MEIHPSYRLDRHFRHASRMTGKIYKPLRSTQKETCQGSSDNVYIAPKELRDAMDGALRLARYDICLLFICTHNYLIPYMYVTFFQTIVMNMSRSFDDGLSECGLVCPMQILAQDSRLDPYYKRHEKKVSPQSTHFPC